MYGAAIENSRPPFSCIWLPLGLRHLPFNHFATRVFTIAPSFTPSLLPLTIFSLALASVA